MTRDVIDTYADAADRREAATAMTTMMMTPATAATEAPAMIATLDDDSASETVVCTLTVDVVVDFVMTVDLVTSLTSGALPAPLTISESLVGCRSAGPAVTELVRLAVVGVSGSVTRRVLELAVVTVLLGLAEVELSGCATLRVLTLAVVTVLLSLLVVGVSGSVTRRVLVSRSSGAVVTVLLGLGVVGVFESVIVRVLVSGSAGDDTCVTLTFSS